MNIEITQEMQDKFRSAIIDEIKRHFPDSDIKAHAVIEEQFFAIKPSIKSNLEIDFMSMIYEGSGLTVDEAMQEAMRDISRIRFMQIPDLVYIRSSRIEQDMDFANYGCTVFQATARIVFVYSEKD